MNRSHPLMLAATTLALALFGSTSAHAASQTASASTNPPVGQATQALLQQQRSGQQATPHKTAPSPEIAQRSYQRYIDSFSQPLPKSLSDDQQRFVNSGR